MSTWTPGQLKYSSSCNNEPSRRSTWSWGRGKEQWTAYATLRAHHICPISFYPAFILAMDQTAGKDRRKPCFFQQQQKIWRKWISGQWIWITQTIKTFLHSWACTIEAEALTWWKGSRDLGKRTSCKACAELSHSIWSKRGLAIKQTWNPAPIQVRIVRKRGGDDDDGRMDGHRHDSLHISTVNRS